MAAEDRSEYLAARRRLLNLTGAGDDTVQGSDEALLPPPPKPKEPKEKKPKPEQPKPQQPTQPPPKPDDLDQQKANAAAIGEAKDRNNAVAQQVGSQGDQRAPAAASRFDQFVKDQTAAQQNEKPITPADTLRDIANTFSAFAGAGQTPQQLVTYQDVAAAKSVADKLGTQEAHDQWQNTSTQFLSASNQLALEQTVRARDDRGPARITDADVMSAAQSGGGAGASPSAAEHYYDVKQAYARQGPEPVDPRGPATNTPEGYINYAKTTGQPYVEGNVYNVPQGQNVQTSGSRGLYDPNAAAPNNSAPVNAPPPNAAQPQQQTSGAPPDQAAVGGGGGYNEQQQAAAQAQAVQQAIQIAQQQRDKNNNQNDYS